MTGVLHVLPIDDLVEHEASGCVCNPRDEAVFRDDGSCAWIVVHHSLDGRELLERQDGQDHGGWETREARDQPP